MGIYTLLLLFSPMLTFAALNDNNPLKDYLTRAGGFIQTIIIPVLFGIAFLFFLINTVRFFIIGADNEEARSKAKTSTLYGLAAFVFLISIWAIIGMILEGLDLGRDTNPPCPDYIKKQDGSCEGGNQNSFISQFKRGGNTFSSNSGSTRNAGGTGNTTSGSGVLSTNTSGLAELIFGTGKDGASFTQFPGPPRAIFQTPQIVATASCTDGLSTLILANKSEATQAAYALYKTPSGNTQWKNITDLSSANHISYDKDTLNDIIRSGATDVRVIHTHPDNRTKQLNLIMNGHGPSAADFKAMCSNASSFSYAVVDKNGIWTYTRSNDTCPYSTNARNILPVIETYQAIALLESSTRSTKLSEYLTTSLTPRQYKEHFSRLNTQSLKDMTSSEILALSGFYQKYASTTVSYTQSPAVYCNTF